MPNIPMSVRNYQQEPLPPEQLAALQALNNQSVAPQTPSPSIEEIANTIKALSPSGPPVPKMDTLAEGGVTTSKTEKAPYSGTPPSNILEDYDKVISKDKDKKPDKKDKKPVKVEPIKEPEKKAEPEAQVSDIIASAAQQIAEGGQMMSTTPGDIMFNTKQEKPTILRDYLKMQQEQRTRRTEEFEQDKRELVREKLKKQKLLKQQFANPKSTVSELRRKAIKELYPSMVKTIGEDRINKMSAEQLQRAIPTDLLDKIAEKEKAGYKAYQKKLKLARESGEIDKDLKKSITATKNVVDLTDRISKRVSKMSKSKFGPIEGLWHEIKAKVYPSDSDVVGLLRNANENVVRFAKDISGAQISDKEMARLKTVLPQLRNTKEVYKELLKSFKRSTTDNFRNRMETEAISVDSPVYKEKLDKLIKNVMGKQYQLNTETNKVEISGETKTKRNLVKQELEKLPERKFKVSFDGKRQKDAELYSKEKLQNIVKKYLIQNPNANVKVEGNTLKIITGAK